MSSPLKQNTTTIQELLTKINNLPEATEQVAPTISVNASGLITATAGTKSSTHQLAFQAAKTITPTTANQIAVSSGYYTGGSVTVKGDSNLVAGNIKSGVSIFGVNGTYEGSGGSSGDTSVEDRLVMRTLTSYTNDRVTSIGSCAFHECRSLTTVNFPVCKTIGIYAFSYCIGLTTVSFPACTSIYSNAFRGCKGLTTVSFPVCTSIGDSAFYACTNLTTVSFPACKTIGSYAFDACKGLTTVSFPVCTSIYNYAFVSCGNLTTVSFPVCTSIYGYAFSACTNLTTVSFPVCKTIGSSAFRGCKGLTTVSFPVCTSIGSYAFGDCTNLISIWLMGSSVCSINKSYVFSNTGIWSNKGSIFVPSSLVASYKTATNWAFFSNRIYSA